MSQRLHELVLARGHHSGSVGDSIRLLVVVVVVE